VPKQKNSHTYFNLSFLAFKRTKEVKGNDMKFHIAYLRELSQKGGKGDKERQKIPHFPLNIFWVKYGHSKKRPHSRR
jgi:hypothetical protein